MEATGRQRHCWECLRRCLVCDGTQPSCKRCSRADTACPGYTGPKPVRLKWLPPGKILSRPRKGQQSSLSISHGHQAANSPPTVSALPQFKLGSEFDVFFEAIRYYNTCIHEDLIPIHQLGHNPHIYRISPDHVQKAPSQPEYVGLGVLCMTLSHRISRIRTQGDSKALVQKFYHYRGNAIRSLSQAIDTTDRRFDDAVLAGILLLLLVDVQQGTSSTWRYHLDAIHKVVEARGGLPRLDASWGLQPLLRSFVMFSVIGNTTCPVPRITMAEWHLHKIHYITEQQSQGPTPFQLCPPVLFGEIIAINAIRTRTSVKSYGTIREAYEILERIHEFSPALWAKSKPIGREHWELAGQVYQAAVALYCILSSQSAFILPHDAMLPAYRAGHAQSLHMLLTDALSNPRIKRFMLWPLVVLGVEAANMEPAVRVCVAGRLADLSHHVGSYAPVEAKLVLETFWASGDTGWDSCFDKPYAFVTQSAVDLTGIPPSSGPV